MAALFEHQMRHENYDYRFVVDFDDVAIMVDVGRLELKAERKNIKNEEWETLVIKLEIHPKENIFRIYFENTLIGTISAGDKALEASGILDEDSAAIDPEHEIDMLENLYENIDNGDVAARLTEEIIQKFPTDPIIGCLIKGATSTLLGQVIRCWYPNQETEFFKEKLGSFSQCLGINKWKMAKTFIWRSGWCAARAGN